LRSRPFAWSGRRRIDGAIRCRQLRAITFRRTTHRTPFQCRGCEPLLVLLGPRGAFTEPRRPLTFSWSLEGTPDRPLCRSTRCPSHGASLSRCGSCNCDSPSSRRTSLRLPREGKTGESPRTPSVVSRACEPKPTSRTSAYLINCERFSAHRFAFSRLVPRVRRCFELPSG
jgi:hypothetical protein